MQAPNVSVEVAVLDNDALMPMLLKGDLDIAITHARKAPTADVTLQPLRDDEFVVYCAGSHRLATRKSITLEDLARERWAAATSASGVLGPLMVLRQALQERALPAPRVALVSDLVMFRLRTVAASDLLGIAIKPNIEEVAAQFRLKTLPFTLPEWRRQVGIAHRTGGYLSPAARRFVDILKTIAGNERANDEQP
jgi:DNA-binding transcriptional LysR family regulator